MDSASALCHCRRERCVRRVVSVAERHTRQAKIAVRLDLVSAGNLGDTKALGGGLSELRIDWGQGYRVYYAMLGGACVLLLAGGDQRKQSSDIEKARAYLKDYERRTRL